DFNKSVFIREIQLDFDSLCTLINETCSITHDLFTKQELPSVIFRQSLPFHDEQSYRNIFDTQRLISGRATFSAIRRYSFFPRTLSDRKSTRLNSSHVSISYAVFYLKTKTMRL